MSQLGSARKILGGQQVGHLQDMVFSLQLKNLISISFTSETLTKYISGQIIDATLASIQGIDFLHGMMGFPWDNLGQDLG